MRREGAPPLGTLSLRANSTGVESAGCRVLRRPISFRFRETPVPASCGNGEGQSETATLPPAAAWQATAGVSRTLGHSRAQATWRGAGFLPASGQGRTPAAAALARTRA